MKLLEIGKIVRPHGVKGVVKIISYVEEDFKIFNNVFIGINKKQAKITKVMSLNNDAYSVCLDIITTVDEAEKFRNQTIYIDRELYPEFQDKLYFSDLKNTPVINEKGEKIGEMIDYDDYGASVILTIKCGISSYMLPYVEEVIQFNLDKQAFIIDQQKFEDMRV